jgi:PAS domain-containing protein
MYKKAPIGLCVYDRDYCYLRANESIAHYSGFSSASELLGKSARDVVPGTDPSKNLPNCYRNSR